MVDVTADPRFAGLLQAIDPVGNLRPDRGQILDDIEGEQETVPEDGQVDTNNVSDLLQTVTQLSNGVCHKTDQEYKRLIAQFEFFLVKHGLIKAGDLLATNPGTHAAHFIVLWIMNHCDEYSINGQLKPQFEERASYGYAQKMRAAATYLYARLLQLGSVPWHKSELTGNMVGNPSISEVVSTYMLSLRRRKVQKGEVPISARAITPKIMGALYDHNHKPENWDIKPYQGTQSCAQQQEDREKDIWTSPCGRRELQLAYTTAFSCLLRIDELMKIQSHDFRLVDGQTLELTLPFRKTDQCGEIKPFVLPKLPEEMAHLCPVRAYADWVAVSEINEGYVFRKLGAGGRPVQNKGTPMVRIYS